MKKKKLKYRVFYNKNKEIVLYIISSSIIVLYGILKQCIFRTQCNLNNQVVYLIIFNLYKIISYQENNAIVLFIQKISYLMYFYPISKSLMTCDTAIIEQTLSVDPFDFFQTRFHLWGTSFIYPLHNIFPATPLVIKFRVISY